MVLQLKPHRLIHGHSPLTALFTMEAMPGTAGRHGSALRAEPGGGARRGRWPTCCTMTSCRSLCARRPPPCSRIWSPVTPSSSGSIRSRPVLAGERRRDRRLHPRRVGGRARCPGRRRRRPVRPHGTRSGRAWRRGVASQIAELGLARHPASAALQQIRQRALTTLRDIYSQTNPFRFIVYSEFAGRGLAPVGPMNPPPAPR